ncbi:MAG: hypothetical protein ACREVL_17905, partial [Solimonas sp.]
ADGRLVFDRTPLREVLAELQRYRTAPLRLADAQIGGLRVSGVFAVDRGDALLDLLPRILPVTVERAADGSVRVSGRAAAPASAAPVIAPKIISTAG